MLLSKSSIASLANLITGNSGISPEHHFDEIRKFFNRYLPCESIDEFKENNNIGDMEEYEVVLKYTVSKLNSLNATSKLTKLVEKIVNSQSFFKEEINFAPNYYIYDIEEAIASINSAIKNDNYEIFKAKSRYRVYGLNDSLVDYRCLFCKNKLGAYVVIKDHIEKCYHKVNNGDYSGAITNARTLVEQILREIETSLNPHANSYDGKLPNLYKRVMRLMNFEDGMPENIKTIYQQILGGLSGSINGFSGLRNTMSDAHPIERIPSENDALLAINEAKTIATFIVRHYFEYYIDAA